MSEDTKKRILEITKKLFAAQGADGISMRDLAKEINISPSVLYHHFKDKDILLKEMFDNANTELGVKRGQLKPAKNATEMLKQRIEFQLDHAEDIVAVLKYFLAYKKDFPKLKDGFVPEKAYLHIQEVLEFGNERKEFKVKNIEDEAKVITHAINGFVLEYYPKTPTGKEKQRVINSINAFILKAIKR